MTSAVLSFSSAQNIIIVGDLQQLPNVLDSKNFQDSEAVWARYSLPEIYHFSSHSLLSSAIATWPEAPTVLLREHYRCHPKIINFCNQKFYGGKLIVMTEDHEEPDVLTMYRTAPGNHARGHLNQRQIDVIRQEVLPNLTRQGYESIGIITPYRDQVAAIQTQLGKGLEVAATAPDGMVEAVYLPEHPFALAVQWHPEFSLHSDPRSGKIFQAFVQACGPVPGFSIRA